MECEALKRVRIDMGLTNVEIMVPFVRTLAQAERVVGHARRARPQARQDGLRVIMMCEVPSNAILAEQFLEHFDGMSIGSNDLTQLTLGLDRDSGLALLARDFDERDPAVKAHDLARDHRLPRHRQVHRHLRPGAERPSRLRRLAGRRGHRVDLAEPGQGGRHLDGLGCPEVKRAEVPGPEGSGISSVRADALATAWEGARRGRRQCQTPIPANPGSGTASNRGQHGSKRRNASAIRGGARPFRHRPGIAADRRPSPFRDGCGMIAGFPCRTRVVFVSRDEIP